MRTSRLTFSAAQNTVTAIERETSAIFVGEPTGSRPNFIGEAIDFELPCSQQPHHPPAPRPKRPKRPKSQRGPGGLRSAVWMIRSMSCGSGSPVAAHMSGNAEAGVIPGMVLISLTRISPAGV